MSRNTLAQSWGQRSWSAVEQSEKADADNSEMSNNFCLCEKDLCIFTVASHAHPETEEDEVKGLRKLNASS